VPGRLPSRALGQNLNGLGRKGSVLRGNSLSDQSTGSGSQLVGHSLVTD
jgi:hypothetical protein